MPDMMNGDFGMISADGTQSFSVSIVPRCAGAAVVWAAHGCSIYLASVKSHDMLLCRRNKDKFEYTVQAKAWKQVCSTDLQMHMQGMHIAMSVWQTQPDGQFSCLTFGLGNADSSI